MLGPWLVPVEAVVSEPTAGARMKSMSPSVDTIKKQVLDSFTEEKKNNYIHDHKDISKEMCKDASDWQLRNQSINIFEPQPTPLCCLLSCFASLWIDAYKSNGKLRQGYKVTTTMITGM